MELMHSGKVREVYRDGDEVILVASDRASVFDVVLPTPIPGKGKILTQLSLWWFDQLADVIGNHVVSATDVPPQWAGRAIRCRALSMVPVECVVRGYLAGSGLIDYRSTGSVCGVPLPTGLVEGSRLAEPMFTPTSKAAAGHDEPMSFEQVGAALGPELAGELRRITLKVYRRGAELARTRGVIVADTKLEFGRTADGTLLLGDELLTSDSSRFWPAESWQPGQAQFALDKQVVRDWAQTTGWDKQEPGPPVPEQIVAAAQRRYAELYERLVGEPWRD